MATVKFFDIQEVSKQNKANGLWITIHGNVYDVTKFADEHPGGGDIIIEHAGQDASVIFEDIGHSNHARELMEQFKIGQLVTADGNNKEYGQDAINKPSTSILTATASYDYKNSLMYLACGCSCFLNNSLSMPVVLGVAAIGLYFAYQYYKL